MTFPLEWLIAASCAYGTNDSCLAGLDQYVKYNKLDKQAAIVEDNVKKKYPAVHLTGTIIGTAVQRKYNFLIYRNFWYNGDYTDIKNLKNMVVFKITY